MHKPHHIELFISCQQVNVKMKLNNESKQNVRKPKIEKKLTAMKRNEMKYNQITHKVQRKQKHTHLHRIVG